MKDSITQAINDWLLTIPLIKEIDDINVEELPDGTKSLALQRTGVVNIKTYYGGLYKQNEYQYMLFLRDYSEEDNQKVKNFDWLDDLKIEINKRSVEHNLPKMNNKIFNSANCINPITYQVSEDGYISDYAVQLYFKINE